MKEEIKEEIEETKEETPVSEEKFSNSEMETLRTENEMLKSRIGQLQAELERLKQAVSFYQQPSSSASTQPDISQINELLYSDPQKAVDILTKTIEQRLYPTIAQVFSYIQAREIRDYFYNTYPDLKGHERIVAVITQELVSQNPQMSLQEILPLIAKRAREYIATLRGQPTKAETKGIYAEEGTKTPSTAKKRSEETPYSPEAELEEELRRWREMQTKKMTK